MARNLRFMTSNCPFENGVTPPIHGPYLPISEDEIASFNDVLSDELDSDYTSSICCCDFCLSEFSRFWPDTAFRNTLFQTDAIDVNWYLEYSRIGSLYTPAERSTVRHFAKCTRCGHTGAPNFWIYEHPFTNSVELERAIDELLEIGAATPFLMLEHPLAKRILSEIRRQASITSPVEFSATLYRARLESEVNEMRDALTTYGPPPARLVKEGRFNHAGSPMLYLASADRTAAAELGQPGQRCLVGELRLKGKFKVLNLLSSDKDGQDDELMQALAHSALLMAPNTGEGWVRRQYIFSRFVADCAQSAGFDAICYGSTKHASSANYVILRPAEAIASFATLIDHTSISSPAPDNRL